MISQKGLRVFYGRASLTQPSSIEFQQIGPALWSGGPAVADVNGDGIDDLVTGAGGTNADQDPSTRFYKGGSTGLPAKADQVISPGIFHSRALGDVDNDGLADVVAGRSGATRQGKAGAGLVRLWWGSAAGISTTGATVDLAQDLPGVPGDVAAGDGFGVELAVGDIDGDRHADVAIGALENASNRSEAGPSRSFAGPRPAGN